MSRALLAGVSGLRVHQQMLDVVGNNLANVNTTGFKAQRIRFNELLYQTLKRATGVVSQAVGGTNPIQIGLGVSVAAIDTVLEQGSLESTGRPLDLAIQGDGFFVVHDGVQQLYTRAGAFSIDKDNFLVDSATGYRVQRFGTIGEGDTLLPRFQVPGDNNIRIPFGTTVPGRATTSIDFRGNLSAAASGPIHEVLTSATPFRDTQFLTTQPFVTNALGNPPADATTLLVNLQGFSFSNGDVITINGTRADGTSIPTQTIIVNTATTTLGDVVNALQTAFGSSAEVTLDGTSGRITVRTEQNGASNGLSLSITDNAGNNTAWMSLTGPGAAVLGGGQLATASTPLNHLATNTANYQLGDTIRIQGTDADGAVISALFVYGVDGTTLGDLINRISSVYPKATASLVNGNLVLTADDPGPASLTLNLSDGPANIGSTNFATHGMNLTVDGKNGDTVRNAIQFYDLQGRAHTITFTFQKQGPNLWDMYASIDPSEGVLLDDRVTSIRFNNDGSFQQVTGAGSGDSKIVVLVHGISVPQEIRINLGESNSYTGVTQFGGSSSASAVQQDGYGAGFLSGLSVSQSGTIEGVFTNGRTLPIAQLAIANFTNPGGLNREGKNYYSLSNNSDLPMIGPAASGGRGIVTQGTLENSNVDVAFEFTRLILAQRGFQVNARTITVSDQMLQELANIIR
ncbi:MAG: flagellar hook-basal body complex protein [Gemmatales bacterium]|nr:flagellar hook-basal body complex protein [Gemmatales bacterium]MDW8175273.1 flagellar hook-basal body complex protein [Gemmatales bacterium]